MGLRANSEPATESGNGGPRVQNMLRIWGWALVALVLIMMNASRLTASAAADSGAFPPSAGGTASVAGPPPEILSATLGHSLDFVRIGYPVASTHRGRRVTGAKHVYRDHGTSFTAVTHARNVVLIESASPHISTRHIVRCGSGTGCGQEIGNGYYAFNKALVEDGWKLRTCENGAITATFISAGGYGTLLRWDNGLSFIAIAAPGKLPAPCT
jgi:hypothetical protein